MLKAKPWAYAFILLFPPLAIPAVGMGLILQLGVHFMTSAQKNTLKWIGIGLFALNGIAYSIILFTWVSNNLGL